MRQKFITAFEHQKLTVLVDPGHQSISPREASRLAQVSGSRPGFCTLGYQSVRLAQYVGLIGIGDRILEVLPKVEPEDGIPEVGRGIFLRLLRLSANLKMFLDSTVKHDLRRQTLLEVFIASFFDAITFLVSRGLLRRYQTLEDDLTVIRGRLLIGRQLTAHAMRADRLACRFDDFTVDNIWNRSLKAALHAIRPWISSAHLRRRWLELSAIFDAVMLIAISPTEVDALRFDRQIAHYKPAIQWARWILRLISPNVRAGQNEAPGLIFDMNQVFESAVTSMLRRAAVGHTAVEVLAQDTGMYLATLAESGGKQAFGLRPDIVIKKGGEVEAVGDVKWTRVDVSDSGHLMPKAAHMYQIQAYASQYPCENFALIYPWYSGLEGSKPTTFALPPVGARNPVVAIICVNVRSDALRPISRGTDSILETLLQN